MTGDTSGSAGSGRTSRGKGNRITRGRGGKGSAYPSPKTPGVPIYGESTAIARADSERAGIARAAGTARETPWAPGKATRITDFGKGTRFPTAPRPAIRERAIGEPAIREPTG